MSESVNNSDYIIFTEGTKDKIIAGVDEVARGTFIGPVVAACVVLPKSFPDETYKQIKDSKKLSEKKREFLASYIKDTCITYGVGEVSNEDIDKINILNATMKAMNRAINEAYKKHSFDYLLIDGPNFKGYVPPGEDEDMIEYECVLQGDSKYLSIAAASIIAKDYHTKLINKLVEDNPKLMLYDIKKNKGYGTKNHLNALKIHGLSEFHRKTFGICKSL
jgi:ribonuclease HII